MFPESMAGLSGREKKIIRREGRMSVRDSIKNAMRSGETWGDQKVSRRIPENMAALATNRDEYKRANGFNRPNHVCKKPGPPHHIIHFEQFLDGTTRGNPHEAANLEVPCKECHNLAHVLKIPSGESIEDFFARIYRNQ